MEEFVGNLWHRYITKKSSHTFPDAAVLWRDLQKTNRFFFRGVGGEPHVQFKLSAPTVLAQHRDRLQKVAGSGVRFELPQFQQDAILMPEQLSVFPTPELNQKLYLWLMALAAHWQGSNSTPINDWFMDNQTYTVATLKALPGLRGIYHNLVSACLSQRENTLNKSRSDDEKENEMRIRQALISPLSQGGATSLLPTYQFPDYVPLWFYPDARASARVSREGSDAQNSEHSDSEKELELRRKAEKVDEGDGRSGLLLFRLESMFSWSEFVKVDRPEDDEPQDDAAHTAEDLDKISVSETRQKIASKVKFDLDLPSDYLDDAPIGDGILLPEWNYKTQQLQVDHCSLQTLENKQDKHTDIPPHLKKLARQIRAQFSQLAPQRMWQKGQEQGDELDLDGWLNYQTQIRSGHSAELRAYRSLTDKHRDICCLLLADLSLSTDAHINNDQKVIDIIRDSLHLFSEALNTLGDPFALYGFSSKYRSTIRYHQVKDFSQAFTGNTRHRIDALTPGYYTRMGAAIRRSTQLLQKQAQKQKLLLILTDGKPNDLDQYEGRYGIEDTKQAVKEARQKGLHPFAITIDKKAESYLPYVFGQNGFAVIRQPEQLPLMLPKLYQQLAG